LIMGGDIMSAPGIVGMVIGFLLLDERDTRTPPHVLADEGRVVGR
jgi:hypothetical protein